MAKMGITEEGAENIIQYLKKMDGEN